METYENLNVRVDGSHKWTLICLKMSCAVNGQDTLKQKLH